MTYMGHILTENRNGFIVETEVTTSGTKQEWEAGISMLAGQSTRSMTLAISLSAVAP